MKIPMKMNTRTTVQMRTKRSVATATAVLAVAIVLGATGLAASPLAQDAPKVPTVVGEWTGGVSTDAGQMQMTVSIKADGRKLSGEISSPHGIFTFTSITQDGERWTLAFKTSDGATGQMKGVVKGDAFTGDWDFKPRATGTFDLKRAKTN